MDPTRFDALARMLFAATTRRGVVGLLLGAGFAGFDREALARSKKRTSKKGIARAKRRREGKGVGEPTRRNAQDRSARQAGAEAASCCASGACAPGQGKNLRKCCYQGQNLTGKNFKGANLDSANFARATLTGANVQGANLGKACLVDATLTGVKTNPSTNWGGAILCRTQTNAGEDNSGCGRGTPCCPTCDARHPCTAGEVCCNGRCSRGDCCDSGQQSTCDDGQMCCAGNCVDGECCQADDCPAQTCHRRACAANRCTYSTVSGEPGPRCQTVCCEDDNGEPVCCSGAIAHCDARGRCCTPERCCIPETKNQTCGVGTASPKCGAVTNNCGTRIDCDACAEKTCQVSNCNGQTNTCIYESVIGGPGTGCQTVCCRNAAGEPVCCDAGVPICLPSGRCGCGQDADCGTDDQCCGGTCIAKSRCCEGSNAAGCGGDLRCCVIAGDGVCHECCDVGHCSSGETCEGGSCRPLTTFERVRAVVATLFGLDEAAITTETEFVRDLNADSLDVVEIILALEEEFAIVIPDETVEELDNTLSVGEVVQAVDELRG
jgi:acyl carrier protein